MQTAIGLVAAGLGVTLVPASVQRLQRDDIAYRPLHEKDVSSPILMNRRSDDDNPDLLRLIEAARAYATPPAPRAHKRR